MNVCLLIKPNQEELCRLQKKYTVDVFWRVIGVVIPLVLVFLMFHAASTTMLFVIAGLSFGLFLMLRGGIRLTIGELGEHCIRFSGSGVILHQKDFDRNIPWCCIKSLALEYEKKMDLFIFRVITSMGDASLLIAITKEEAEAWRHSIAEYSRGLCGTVATCRQVSCKSSNELATIACRDEIRTILFWYIGYLGFSLAMAMRDETIYVAVFFMGQSIILGGLTSYYLIRRIRKAVKASDVEASICQVGIIFVVGDSMVLFHHENILWIDIEDRGKNKVSLPRFKIVVVDKNGKHPFPIITDEDGIRDFRREVSIYHPKISEGRYGRSSGGSA